MKLSIVITAYNVELYIKDCIKSILAQNIKNEFEIIIVEDKSTDNTLEILKEFEDYNNIKIITHDKNKGPGLSRRDGISHCSGNYIMLIDGDDYLIEENYIQTLIDKAVETDADIIGGGIKIQYEDGSSKSFSHGNNTYTGYEKLTKLWGNNIVFINNKIIKKTLYEKIPYSNRRYIEDTQVIIPMLWLSNKIECVDVIGYVYRQRPNSLTHEANEIKNVIFKALCWCDLIEFFNVNDQNVFNVINLKQYITNCISYFNNKPITAKDINPYINEFAELMFKLINIIKIINIDFKPTKLNK